MKQASLGARFELEIKTARKREFLRQRNRVASWRKQQEPIAPHMPDVCGSKSGRPYPVSVLLRVHFLPHGLALSDPAAQAVRQRLQRPHTELAAGFLVRFAGSEASSTAVETTLIASVSACTSAQTGARARRRPAVY